MEWGLLSWVDLERESVLKSYCALDVVIFKPYIL